MKETVLFLCSLSACLIGVLTFVVGMRSRAKNEGILQQKLEQALSGIEEIKKDVKANAIEQNRQALLIQSHEEKIQSIFHQLENNKQIYSVLESISETLKQLSRSGNILG